MGQERNKITNFELILTRIVTVVKNAPLERYNNFKMLSMLDERTKFGRLL
jgi:hypothetical protein